MPIASDLADDPGPHAVHAVLDVADDQVREGVGRQCVDLGREVGDACAYEWSPGQVLRISVAGTDWPNTVAPPAPVTLTVHAAEIELPVLGGAWPSPTFGPGAEHTSESSEGIAWEIHDDVLARTTTARTVSVSEYETPYDGRALEDYRGEVGVDRRTFARARMRTRRTSCPGRASASG